MARNRTPRTPRARDLAFPAALALMVLATLALALVGSHGDARQDLEQRFADRATSTASLVDALLQSMATGSAAELTARSRHGGPTKAQLEQAVRSSKAVYALVAGADGRVRAASRRTPAAAAARAREAADRLGFPGAPPFLISPAVEHEGRALLEIAIAFRAGKAKHVHLAGIPAEVWSRLFDPTLGRALQTDGTRALVVDDRDRVLGDSSGVRHPAARYGRQVIGATGRGAAFTASSPVGRSPLRVVHVTSRERLYAPVGGRRGWAPWVALALAALAMGGGLWLMERLRSSHLALRRSEERYALALRAANDALWDWDLETGRVHYSERWTEMVGAPAGPADDVGRWLDRVHPDDRAALDAAIDAHLAGVTGFLDHEHRLRAASGDWMWVLVRGLAVFGHDGRATRMAGSLSDVTARRRALAHLEHQATHDPLTGLANRAHFFSVLERSLERARHGRQPPCAVVFLDLDGFKLVNDRHGHVIGDAVLATVATRLRHAVRPGDLVGRLGGDELAVLLPACPDPDEAAAVAERLGDALCDPCDVLGESIQVGVSAGVAVSAPGVSAEQLLREADAAMYRAKLAI